ncbi:unnamed protein product [Polarella glacialis]|uniref:Uncharacterized protein n=1 Tax=Polarella glacialis TaxID=89957 RepID=A0A813F8W9_POLGL|nr:unnamed protein product [Polarella glacialis]|mmetsp:Transcript_62010/g.111627  ORF Transcript_62010/g.111627 Transcript_62010/m.111627 type:complete len:206 (-) Transcript_62010:102-719(-)
MEDGRRPATGFSVRSGRSAQSVGSRHSRVSVSYSQRSRASEVDASRVPPRHRTNYDHPHLPQAGAFSLTGLPGYTGYVPGKVSENVHGLSFHRANERAFHEADTLRTTGQLPMPYRGRTFHMPGPGQEVPGYMGFVPGRISDNVIGQTAARGAESSWIIKQEQAAERHHRVNCYRQGVRPATGSMDYTGYKSQMAHPDLDSRFAS